MSHREMLIGAMWLVMIAGKMDMTHRQKNTLLAVALMMLQTHTNIVYPRSAMDDIPF